MTKTFARALADMTGDAPRAEVEAPVPNQLALVLPGGNAATWDTSPRASSVPYFVPFSLVYTDFENPGDELELFVPPADANVVMVLGGFDALAFTSGGQVKIGFGSLAQLQESSLPWANIGSALWYVSFDPAGDTFATGTFGFQSYDGETPIYAKNVGDALTAGHISVSFLVFPNVA